MESMNNHNEENSSLLGSTDGDVSKADEAVKTLEFFMTVGKLKHLKRTGWLNNDIPDCESVAGHMYRMSIMTFLLDKSDGKDLDRNRCIKMALVHDMAECIVGDLTPFCGVSKEDKHCREMAAMKKLSSLIEEKIGREMFELYKEYEAQETTEAKAVKDIDRFDMILQAYEYEKSTKNPKSLQDFFNSTEGSFQNSDVMKWVQQLNEIRSQDS